MLVYIVFISFFGLVTLIQLYYILKYYWRLAIKALPIANQASLLPVSIIIAARNESEHLQKYLDSILQQDYPNFEVIVVNDCSYDNSTDLLKGYKERYAHLKVLELAEDDRFKHGKKFALTLGIKSAQHEHLLFTDADCMPVSNQWLRNMQSFFEGKEIVLGYSPFEKSKGLLNRIARFENFQTALNYLSFSLKGNTYMGVGRNLAYEKSLFFKHKGFASHMHLQSGDDDLFVNQAATKSNVSVCLHPDSFVYTPAKQTWSGYFIQKLRHYGVGSEYKKSNRIAITMQSLSGMLFYIVGITLACLNIMPIYVAAIAALRILPLTFIYFKAMKRLQVIDLYWSWIIQDFLYYLFIPFWSLLVLFSSKKRWN